MLGNADPADRTARPRNLDRGLHRLVEADAFEDRIHAVAVGQLLDALDRLGAALADDVRRAERLREMDEMKNTFLAAVSHELRSPLTSILGLALTLERQTLSASDQSDLLGRLAMNARKLDRLLKDLLDIDRLLNSQELRAASAMAPERAAP